MAEIRLEAAVRSMVDEANVSLDELVAKLTEARDIAQALTRPARGLNGLASYLRGQVNQLDEMIKNTEAEKEAVRKHMLGEGGLPAVEVIVEHGTHRDDA